jgi:purine-binding chemotaxis protein CheW
VREVLDRSPETHVPRAPAFADALINFRGRVIPLADLRRAFGLDIRASSRDSRVIVIAFEIAGEAQLIGLRADKVHEVTVLPDDATEAPPRLGLRWRADFILGLAKRGDDIIILPDLERIFAANGHAVAEPHINRV